VLPLPLSLPDPLDPYQPPPAPVAAGETGDSGDDPAVHRHVSAFEDALAWAQRWDPAKWCIITIGDSGTYTAPSGGWHLTLAKNQQVRIISAPEASPVLDGTLHIEGADLSVIQVSGVLLGGPLTYEGTGDLQIEHTAIASGDQAAALRVGGGMTSAQFCILGPVEAGADVALSICDTIVDGLGGAAITCKPGARAATGTTPGGTAVAGLDIQRTTVHGTTEADIITAQDSIFTGPLTARQPHRGLIGYSYYPAGSTAPPLIAGPLTGTADGWPQAAEPPQFTSTDFGSPAYMQLAYTCPPEIASGARLGGEMGAYNYLQQPFRAARLLTALDEMLPAGRTVTVIYRT
jgi:hypothetical protein